MGIFVGLRMKKIKHYTLNLVLPILYYGAVTGILTAAAVTFYKWCAKHVIAFSQAGYAFLREQPYWLVIVLPVLLGVAFFLAWTYKKWPNLRGGGIPTSIGIVRGVITFQWLRSLLGLFFASLTSFLIGVPLGNEGPSVQMGTALGKATLAPMSKRQKAWGRYAMTGGACVGFATATGAPISGILFAVEEAHERISPVIVLVVVVSVVFGQITAELLSPLMGVSVMLFEPIELLALGVADVWLPLLIGAAFGAFAVLFLRYYKTISKAVQKFLKPVKSAYKSFATFALTVFFGLLSTSFISTGHGFIEGLFEERTAWYFLLCVLAVRMTLTAFANVNGVTGGIFLPTLAIGGAFAALIGEILIGGFGLSETYYSLILVLGVTACIASMMKMPVTAIVFAVEALGCYRHILYVIVVVAVAFAVTEIFGAKSINDLVLKSRLDELYDGKVHKVEEAYVTVEVGSFAVGKQIRDILWPANLFVLSVAHGPRAEAQVDEHGGSVLREGDVLHVRYLTYDEEQTLEDIYAIVGEQSVEIEEIEKV